MLTHMLQHCRALHAAARNCGVQACVDLDDMALVVQMPCGNQRWLPRFMVREGDRLAYVRVLADNIVGFAGWLPYEGRRWPEGTGKAAFKRHADRCGVTTPAACTDPQGIHGPFLVKRNDGSFGQGQRGPFLRWNPDAAEQRLAPGEYYENFIPGLIAKAWCWGGRCVALELQSPPVVTGDGSRTMRELAHAVIGPGKGHEPVLQWLATFHGLASPDDAVPHGRQVLAHYRYGSAVPGASDRSPNMLEPARASGLTAQFERAAAMCGPSVSRAGHPEATLYTLDAVVDEEGTAWFLEMNCNPLVHPDAYAAILASAVQAGATQAEPVPVPQALAPA